MRLIRITNDLFDIAARLKSVKESYVVYYNADLDRFEVHDTEQKGSTLAFVSPYKELDCRTVDYALYTSVKNAREVYADIERNNMRQCRENAEKTINKFMNNYYKKEVV